MVSLTIDIVTWGAYFSIGILLLVMLVFARRAEKKIDARRHKVDKTMQRFHVGKEVDNYRGNHYK